MKRSVMYGAGNIGRGFIGQLFSESGYEVIFIDVNMDVVNKINQDGWYPVKIVSDEKPRECIVTNVRAVDGRDIEKVAQEIAQADIVATAVGVNVLPRIIEPIARGLKLRWKQGNIEPLNIIICENLIGADRYLSDLILKELNSTEKILFESLVGLVEAAIGRMVPVMTQEIQDGNILRICVEEFNQLPVDQAAFKGVIPEISNMIPFSPFEYYIHRKLFIHNLGHAVAAYLGHLKKYTYIWEAIEDEEIKEICKAAMSESAKALAKEYSISIDTINEHVDDLIKRFGNRMLGDTIERVGKDPIRKLSSNDRLVGALNLCLEMGVKPTNICKGIAAGLCFDVTSDEAALKIQASLLENGLQKTLADYCKISEGSIGYILITDYYTKYSRTSN